MVILLKKKKKEVYGSCMPESVEVLRSRMDEAEVGLVEAEDLSGLMTS